MADQISDTMRWVTHQGYEILLADYGELRGDELVQQIRVNRDAIVKLGLGGRRDLLVLTDVTRATIGTEVLAAFKDVAKAMKPYTRASAVVGITSARKFLLQAVNMFSTVSTEPMDSVEKAKSWLVGRARS